MALLFKCVDPRGKVIGLTSERHASHIHPEHPEATPDAIRECILDPETIREDPDYIYNREIYYRGGVYGGYKRTLRVAVEMSDDRGFGYYPVKTAWASGHPSPEERIIWQEK